jgi:4-carboxymuconolactone decarboxylase
MEVRGVPDPIRESTEDLPQHYRRFSEEHRQVWEALEALGEAASGEGPLDHKTRELVKLGMAAGVGSITSVQSHTRRALSAGATPEEVEHTIILGVTTMGFPKMMAALKWARSAMDGTTGSGETTTGDV